MSTKISIVDDHKIFLDGMSMLLEEVPDFEVVSKYTRASDLFDNLDKIEVDILLLDIELPGANGIDIVKTLKSRGYEVKILMLTMYKESEIIKKAIKSGANGYILKNADRKELIQAIETICSGDNYYSPEVMQTIMETFQPQSSSTTLSERELQIIRLIADQHTTKEIAAKLHLSPYTVETHRKNILLKLGLKNTAGLIRYALKKGFID